MPWWKAFTGRVLSNILKDAAVQQGQGTDKNSAFLSEGFDGSQLESAFTEATFSRNLTVSRSGRFKEKRKVRSTLPPNKNLYESNTAVAK